MPWLVMGSKMSGTEQLVRLLDAFFDCLNMRVSPKEYIHKRKANLVPYTGVTNIQFEVYELVRSVSMHC